MTILETNDTEQSSWSKAASLLIVLILIAIALCHMILAISVNAGRISHLQRLEAGIQDIAGQIARDPKSTEVPALQTHLVSLNNERDSQIGQVEYGQNDFWDLPGLHCVIPTDAKCFHKNASETNNLFLALASGVIGASLYLLLGLYLQVSASSTAPATSSVLAVATFLPLGMMVGLATLFAIRGTKGALLAPVANVVQIENPYGIAFVATLAAFGSVRILTLASGFIDQLPNLWKSNSKPEP